MSACRDSLSLEQIASLRAMGAREHTRPLSYPIAGFTDHVAFSEEMVAAGALRIQMRFEDMSYFQAADLAKLIYGSMAAVERQTKS